MGFETQGKLSNALHLLQWQVTRLIEIGGLADIAGVADLDKKGALLGAFLELNRLLLPIRK